MARNKRLQVFISSTYADLQGERQAAVEAILTAGHIPAGMELFAAGDQSQMSVIRRWIDDSDVFLLILGGRYGSIEPATGKSYVELEYEYAVAAGKPVFAVAITDDHLDQKVRLLGRDAIETVNGHRLQEFRSAVCSSRIVRFWRDPRDIKLAILETLAEFARRDELVGWVAGDEAVNAAALAEQLARLTKENNDLRERLAQIVPPATFHGLTFEQLYALVGAEELPLTDFDEDERRLLSDVAALFGDRAPAVVHAFWLWRDDFLRSQPLVRNDPEAKKFVFRTLLGYGLLRQTEARLFTLTAEGRQFLLRLTLEKAGDQGERYRPGIRAAARADARSWPIGFCAERPDAVSRIAERLSDHIIGQSDAIARVVRAITLRLAGLQPGHRPIASFFIAGSRGVGKTSLAHALADVLFDDAAALITIDMSDYQEAHTVSQLVGAPPGYVGYGQASTLADRVAERRQAVVVLEDFHKAHLDVQRSIYQVIADGVLTDSLGRNVDFSDTVIVMTGAPQRAAGTRSHSDDERNDAVVDAMIRAQAEVARWLEPRLLDALDDVIVLRPLPGPALRHIVKREVDHLRQHLAVSQLGLSLSEDALDVVASQVTDYGEGAHGVRRAVRNHLAIPLGEMSIARRSSPGDLLTVECDASVSPPQLRFDSRRSAETTPESASGADG